MNKLFLIFIILIFLILNIFSEALPFYTNNGAKNTSLGDIGTALDNTISSLFYNPAIYYDNNYIWAEHVVSLLDITIENFGIKYGYKKYGVLSSYIKYTKTDSIISLNNHGDTIGSYGYKYYQLNFAYSYIWKDLSVGLDLCYYNETNGTMLYSGVLLNTGLKYKYIIKDRGTLLTGVSFRNIAFKNDIPYEFRLGNSFIFSNIPLLISMDMGYNSLYKFIGGIGTSYTIKDILALNIGYNFDDLNYSDNIFVHFRTGIGIDYRGMNINYGIKFIENMNPIHFIDVGYKF